MGFRFKIKFPLIFCCWEGRDFSNTGSFSTTTLLEEFSVDKFPDNQLIRTVRSFISAFSQLKSLPFQVVPLTLYFQELGFTLPLSGSVCITTMAPVRLFGVWVSSFLTWFVGTSLSRQTSRFATQSQSISRNTFHNSAGILSDRYTDSYNQNKCLVTTVYLIDL